MKARFIMLLYSSVTSRGHSGRRVCMYIWMCMHAYLLVYVVCVLALVLFDVRRVLMK
jgi:hypothetical protein